jgi:hypothetical protein
VSDTVNPDTANAPLGADTPSQDSHVFVFVFGAAVAGLIVMTTMVVYLSPVGPSPVKLTRTNKANEIALVCDAGSMSANESSDLITLRVSIDDSGNQASAKTEGTATPQVEQGPSEVKSHNGPWHNKNVLRQKSKESLATRRSPLRKPGPLNRVVAVRPQLVLIKGIPALQYPNSIYYPLKKSLRQAVPVADNSAN